MARRTVVVLGGGIGGLATANELRRRLGPRDRVVVVERERRHLFQPSLLWLMVGRRRREQIERPLRSLLARGVELVEAPVQAINPQARTVETSAGVLSPDALIVALGAELAPDGPRLPRSRPEHLLARRGRVLRPGARDVPRWPGGGRRECPPVQVPRGPL